ncbi:hypothetical protein SAMN05661080_03679 [Modestobacter sp. DSM 44400]|nr:hypothetical protein SAMN05661080_03679 [Modestobacter sp. DSM 44400]
MWRAAGGTGLVAVAAGRVRRQLVVPGIHGVRRGRPDGAGRRGHRGEAVPLRTDEAVGRQVQVRLTDTGTAPFTVTAVAIDSPGLVALPPTVVHTTFAPG